MANLLRTFLYWTCCLCAVDGDHARKPHRHGRHLSPDDFGR